MRLPGKKELSGDGVFHGCRRWFIASCFCSIAFVLIVFSSISLALVGVAGDVAPRGNPDGRIDSADVILLQRMVLGEIIPTSDELLAGDVAPLGNPDGALTMADVLVLQRAVLGEIALPPIYVGPPAPADASKIDLVIGNDVVTVVGAAGSVQPFAIVTISNAWREMDPVVVTANADGSFSAQIYALLGDKLTITISNSSGETSTPVDIAVMKIAITTPVSGITVYGGEYIAVQGTVLAPSYARVVVGGDYADVSGATFYGTAWLDPGTNIITATVSRPGLSVSHSITVTWLPATSSPVQVTVSPLNGLAPLDVRFAVQTSGPSLQRLQIDYDSDEEIDYDSSEEGLPATSPVTEIYSDPGTYEATVTATDSTGNIHVSWHEITVSHPKDSMLRGIYEDMLEDLRQGNIEGAVARFSGSSQEKYRGIFTTLQPDLPTIVNQMGMFDSGLMGEDWAEYVLLREENGEPRVYLIYFLRGEDGVWRIEGM